MKKILLISVFITFVLSCFSQDYLILRDGTEEAVVVLEVTPDVVKYRYYGTNSRAVYSTWKSDVRKIVYEDGEEVVFTANRRQISEERSYTTNRGNLPNRQRSQEYSNVTNRRNAAYGSYSATDRRQSYDEYWDDSEPVFQIGIKGGANISNISGIAEVDYMIDGAVTLVEPIFRFHVGAVAQFNLSNGLFIQPEILYSSQGCKIYGEATTLGYIQIPAYLGYKIPVNNNFDVMLGAGLYFAYGVYGKYDIFEVLDRADFGLSFLWGVQFNKMQLTAGYDLGLVDIMDIDGWDTIRKYDKSIPKIANRNLKISIAHFF